MLERGSRSYFIIEIYHKADVLMKKKKVRLILSNYRTNGGMRIRGHDSQAQFK